MAYSDKISIYDDRPILEVKSVLNWSASHENKANILHVLCDHIHQLEQKVEALEEKMDKIYSDLYD